jgi:hypothetical protein
MVVQEKLLGRRIVVDQAEQLDPVVPMEVAVQILTTLVQVAQVAQQLLGILLLLGWLLVQEVER